MLKLQAKGNLEKTYPYPLQCWRLGDLLWITMGGEVVVDFSLKFKRQFGAKTWVTAYCNDVMAYIPSKRVLLEGGYEAGGAMRYFRTTVHPGYWHESLEERIVGKVHELDSRLAR